MAGCCSHSTCDASAASPRLRLALWIALIVNAVMFLVEFFVRSPCGPTPSISQEMPPTMRCR